MINIETILRHRVGLRVGRPTMLKGADTTADACDTAYAHTLILLAY